jgi:hypothetical protein
VSLQFGEQRYVQAFHLLCDEQIGSGIARNVFSSQVLASSVVKVEDRIGSFQNVVEWETWQRVKETEFAKWFAPCEWISGDGSILVMKRTQPAREGEFPKKMPAFLTDFKRTNYGVLGKRIVCHDYGLTTMLECGMTKRMKNVNWWDL